MFLILHVAGRAGAWRVREQGTPLAAAARGVVGYWESGRVRELGLYVFVG